jgi:hypothetical protein
MYMSMRTLSREPEAKSPRVQVRKSAAAPYVNMQSITLAPLNFVYGSKDVSFNYSVGPDFDDPDL